MIRPVLKDSWPVLLLVVAVVGGTLALGRDSLTIASLTLTGAFFTLSLLLSESFFEHGIYINTNFFKSTSLRS